MLRQSDSTITKILLFGDIKLDFKTNKILLMSTIEFISLTERFGCPLFERNFNVSYSIILLTTNETLG